MLVVIAEVMVKEGTAAQFLQATPALIAETRKEAGCIAYDLLNDTANKNKFVFVEQWESQAILDQHMATPHFKKFAEATKSCMAGDLGLSIFEATVVV